MSWVVVAHMPLIPAVGRKRQADLSEFEASQVFRARSKQARTVNTETLSLNKNKTILSWLQWLSNSTLIWWLPEVEPGGAGVLLYMVCISFHKELHSKLMLQCEFRGGFFLLYFYILKTRSCIHDYMVEKLT